MHYKCKILIIFIKILMLYDFFSFFILFLRSLVKKYLPLQKLVVQNIFDLLFKYFTKISTKLKVIFCVFFCIFALDLHLVL